MDKEDLKYEYKDVSENVRHFQTVRFAQLTIFIAVSAGIMGFLFARLQPQPPAASLIGKIAGLTITILFWVLQERTMLYWRHFIRRAVQLEEELGYRQYSTLPSGKLVTSTNALRLFYFVLAIFWFSSLIWFP